MAILKQCIVTGGSKGIGRAITESFMQSGYSVAVFDIDNTPLEEEYREAIFDNNLTCYQVDISDQVQIQTAIQDVMQKYGRIDVLVNNAGILSLDNFYTESIEGWMKVIQVNLNGTFMCCKQVVEVMKKQKSGSIINIISISALKESKFSSPSYCASKAGIVGMSRCLAAQAAEFNIRVNCVAPSTTDTSMLSGLPEKRRQAYEKLVPLGRLAIPADVANAVDFLASDKSNYITGEILNVNGGMLMP
jgi:NAD(P)-dependent dehydrogenase (short-subunit alcohol dehydrogenase family)